MPARLARRVPFRLKVAAVWVVIFVVLGASSARRRLRHATGCGTTSASSSEGCATRCSMAVGGIVLAIVLALARRPGADLAQPDRLRHLGLLRVVLPGHAADRADVPIYLALPQVGRNLGDRYAWLPDGFDPALVLGAATAGTIALGPQLRRLHDRDLPGRHPVGRRRSGRGRRRARDDATATRCARSSCRRRSGSIIPPTGNEFIAMMKDTALVSFLGVTAASAEIFRRAQLVGKADFKNLEAYVAAALIYWVLTVVFSFFQRRLETRIGARLRPRRTSPRADVAAVAARPAARRRWRVSEQRRRRPGRRAAQDLRPPRGGQGRRPGRAHAARSSSSSAAPGRASRPAALRELPRGPDRGHIEVAGIRLGGGHRTRRKREQIRQLRLRVGMVFQQFNLFPHMTVLDNVMSRPAARGKGAGRPRSRSAPSTCSTRSAWPTRPTSTRSGCRAVSSSGWRSPARWRWSPR